VLARDGVNDAGHNLNGIRPDLGALALNRRPLDMGAINLPD
jgi:hypothetical protein